MVHEPSIRPVTTVQVYLPHNPTTVANARAELNRQIGKNIVLDVVRAAARFFSGVPHPHLLGDRCPDLACVWVRRPVNGLDMFPIP